MRCKARKTQDKQSLNFEKYHGCKAVGIYKYKMKIKVIYIICASRSGSTLLGRILGQHKDLFYAGEIEEIWEKSFIENQLCGCGKLFKECNVWQKIIPDFLNKNKGKPYR